MRTLFLAAITIAPQLAAQGPTTSFLMDMPVTVMSPNSGNTVMLSNPGDPAVPLTSFPALVPMPSGFTINSFSRGTGAFYSDAAFGTGGLPYVFPSISADDQWSFLLFSVSSDGVDGATFYDNEGNLDGDIFAYIDAVDDDTMPPGQIQVVHKMREGSEIGLGPLTDIDSYMPGYDATDDYVDEYEMEMGDGSPSFYFTVHNDRGDYSGIPASWGNGASVTDWRQPSTIFSLHWKSGAWSGPEVYRTYDELDIDPADVIDALCVMDPQFIGAPNLAQGIDVLYSLDNQGNAGELRVLGEWVLPGDTLPTIHAGPLMTVGEQFFVEGPLGFVNGGLKKIRSACAEDPGHFPGGPPHDRLRRERTAFLAKRPAGSTNRLTWSMHQISWGGNPGDPTRCCASLQGILTQDDDTGQLLSIDPSGGVTVVGSVSRTPGQGLDKKSLVFDIPYVGLPSTVPMQYQWLVLDRNLNAIGTSHIFELLVR